MRENSHRPTGNVKFQNILEVTSLDPRFRERLERRGRENEGEFIVPLI